MFRPIVLWTVLVSGCFTAACATHARQPTTVFIEAGATVAPRVARQAPVEIPAELRGRRCTSGLAVVEVEVDASGRVQRARLSRASAEPAFDQACVRSAFASKYQPGNSHGQPAAGLTRIECRLECP